MDRSRSPPTTFRLRLRREPPALDSYRPYLRSDAVASIEEALKRARDIRDDFASYYNEVIAELECVRERVIRQEAELERRG